MKRCALGIYFLFGLMSSVALNAQNMSVENRVKPAFEKYFGLPRASVFLHLNKNAFVEGEYIWFKGYLYNRLKERPFGQAVNLYVGVYDKEGNQVKKYVFISKNGYSQGQIKIDSTFEKGDYYVKGSTSWMRNFKEDDAFVQQFSVLGEEVVYNSKSIAAKYDIQFLPEGGHWVANVHGVLGIKAIDAEGASLANVSGIIRNQKGEAVSSFLTNQFGLAKVTVTPLKGDSYTAFVRGSDGISREFRLPKPDDLGLVLSVKQLRNEHIMILVGTNAQTKKKIGSKPHSILIYRDGLLKNLELVFKKDDLYVSHILQKKEFHKGMNIITIVDNLGNPISERLFFNFNGLKEGYVTTEVQNMGSDSLSVVISNNKSSKISSLSVSILPKETKAYLNNFNIKSTFLVKPYLKGFAENLGYYFEERSKAKEAELDLLLITQGWSRYDWKNIYSNPPKKKYDFRTGIDLFGQVNKEFPKKTELLLYAGINKNPQVIGIDKSSQSFKLHNYYFEEGERLQLTLLNKRGELERPSLYLRANSGVTEDKIFGVNFGHLATTFSKNFDSVEVNDFILSDNTIRLDEVIVSEERSKKEITSPVIPERKIKKMTVITERQYPNLIDLIRSSGFNVWEMPNTGYDRIRITTKRPLVFSLTQPSPILYIDDVRYGDFNILLDFKTTKVKAYYIDRSGNGEAGAAGGVIRIYTRKEGEIGAASTIKPERKTKFFTYIVDGGFTPEKKYYMPKYRSFEDASFRNFGAIHWEPNISLDASGKGKFQIYNIGLQEIVLFIEGMHVDGTLFSSKHILKVPSNQ